jgi:hypothetical protein
VIDRLVVPVSDIAASKVFYSQGLAPLGYEILFEKLSPETGQLAG